MNWRNILKMSSTENIVLTSCVAWVENNAGGKSQWTGNGVALSLAFSILFKKMFLLYIFRYDLPDMTNEYNI